jgi:outer membrane biogenesis lipoprotein LolB
VRLTERSALSLARIGRTLVPILAVIIFLSGCAQTRMPAPDRTADLISEGQWSGRFALKVERLVIVETQSLQQDSAQGGFSLQSSSQGASLELISPLGQTIAIVRSTPTLATLTLADGKQFEAANAQDLLERQLGWRLPIDRLPRAFAALKSDTIATSDKAEVISQALGRDWAAQITELEGARSRLVLTWQGLSTTVSKLVLTLIIDAQLGVSTNLRR